MSTNLVSSLPVDLSDSASTKPLRVLFLSHDGSMAGAQRMLLTLIEGLDRNLVYPVLVVPYRRELSAAAEAIGVTVEVLSWAKWVPSPGVTKRLARWKYIANSILKFPACLRRLNDLMTNHRIDLVYSNTVTMLEGALAARLAGKPHIWHIHEPIQGNNELTPLFPMWAYQSAIRTLSNQIIFPSKSAAATYPILEHSANIIYNGLLIPKLRDRYECHKKIAEIYQLSRNCKFVGIVGTLQPRKDHFTFIEMALAVKMQYQDVQFLIVGVGDRDNTEQIKSKIEALELTDTIHMVGQWTPQIADLMASLDVLVISSEQESFGLTAIEALSVETPVVSTACGGPQEIILDGINGYIVPIKCVQSMAQSVVSLLKDPEFAKKMGATGRSIVLDRFAQENYVRRIQALLVGLR
jgi:glycosyltransferase involved in cell wall biosynthesis